MQWGVILMVALGGALGSVVRYTVAGAVQPAWWPGFPFGIFVVNITGGLVMGLITAMAALKLNLTPEMRAFLTTGILGGYTTFSTFSLDSAMLMERGRVVDRRPAAPRSGGRRRLDREAAVLEVPGAGKLPPKRAHQKGIEVLAKSCRRGVALRRGVAMMAMDMGDAEMPVAHAGEKRRAQQACERAAAMHGFMRRQHAEHP